MAQRVKLPPAMLASYVDTFAAILGVNLQVLSVSPSLSLTLSFK